MRGWLYNSKYAGTAHPGIPSINTYNSRINSRSNRANFLNSTVSLPVPSTKVGDLRNFSYSPNLISIGSVITAKAVRANKQVRAQRRFGAPNPPLQEDWTRVSGCNGVR
ncbi:unnamed protein product [Periconia digitata]|uniref:Uncharacterized protein n=1 Tax=Periconia digitata TaxID=1303443 RepID=A0A9W4UB12_9PLEO|nr:unnamed protein product [Periconia digitata]